VSGYAGRRVTFGFNPTNDLFATDIECDHKGTRFRLNNSRREVFVPMLGRHAAVNALAAIAVARRMGVDEDLIIRSLAKSDKPEMRLQLFTVGKLTVLNDAYNANPASMRAALETLGALPQTGRRIAVLGDMRELGESTDRYHREIGEFVAKECQLDKLFCVGEKARLIAEAAEHKGMAKANVLRLTSAAEAARVVPKRLKDGDLVLLKASRGVHLETLAQAITESAPRRLVRRVAS
jgi:UDP-N-acetylmuramoyl-tripeptide--D-alanyl-D-alanine ligase